MKRVLVTGGAGFIGSHLCERLLNEGNEVFCMDNLETGSIRNIETFKENPLFHFIQQDVIEPIELRVDEIFNFACPASPPRYQKDPVHTLKTSVLGALNLLELATNTGAKIMQASTSEVYGDPAISPQPETYWGNVNPIGPRSCYDEGKRCAETLFFDYGRQFGTKIKVIRIFNTYGPRMDPEDGRVVSNFIAQALKNEPLTVYGDGSQTRSFCYIDDLIEGIMSMMQTDESFSGPVNLGNPEEVTVLEVAKLVLELTCSKSEIEFRPLPQDDPKRRKPDITLARQTLGWEPTVKLKEGLITTIQYFRECLRF
ncbi:NAD-dependent dehydratase [Coprothermobacter proteolyticus DSM 5265]|uniref:UDP-glucuronate decarboxylase n=1 Tax=Coprothermobacter proteolyticus (strain ATCC 35245 / DSM 5265 / OCM 4 / BT) TaxID=309798 RepID=B5Y7Q0_COPPD|nr:UDP-glucuronic acid decarboxylase family protein [Coprothermobacter proteolyticus]ACI16921.1 NAD-dependent dehydratase [Coprothermobacter proteolyticus DSM 5265]